MRFAVVGVNALPNKGHVVGPLAGVVVVRTQPPVGRVFCNNCPSSSQKPARLGQFVQNAMLPLKIESIKEEEGIIVVHGKDEKTRGLMIGAKARNLRWTESVVQIYFPQIKEIKVV